MGKKTGKISGKSRNILIAVIAVAVIALIIVYVAKGGNIVNLIKDVLGIEYTTDTAPGSPASDGGNQTAAMSAEPTGPPIDENGKFFSKDEVALYIHTYGKLPSNFVTKAQAKEKGWEGGSVEKYFPGCAIGGDRFGNNEGLLPKKSGRTYYECDIDTDGGKARGAKRIIYSNDGLVYYTEDHYESFRLLYGTP